VITFPGNARDPWIPDAVAMAGIKHGPELLRDLMQRRLPNDSMAVAGMRRSVHKMARHFAARSEVSLVVQMISTVPQSSGPLAVAMLNGIAEGWPLDTLTRVAPQFTAEQRAALVEVGRVASPEITEALARVAARWNLPNAFKPE
jgi:23S rRNA C2498 (ribose-2'-O)-methylase RlmM